MTLGTQHCKNLFSLDGELVPAGLGLWLGHSPTVGSGQQHWPASGPGEASSPFVQVALASFSQVWRMQDRLPSELPGRGEGLPPLCPPAQIPRAERSHLTQSPDPPQRPQGEGSAQPCSWVCHQPRPLSQGVTAVSLIRKTQT